MAGCTDAILAQLTALLGDDGAGTICGEDGPGCAEDASGCAIGYLAGKVADAQSTADDAYLGLNVSWLLNSGYMVSMMKGGCKENVKLSLSRMWRDKV